MSRRGKVAAITVGILFVLFIILVIFTSFYTDLLWFDSMEKRSVFTTQIGTRSLLFVIFGVLMAVIVGVNLWLAYKFRPRDLPRNQEQLSLDRYREGLEPLRLGLGVAVAVVLGLIAGVSAQSEWRTWALWRNRQEFGETDPFFNLDIGFFVFSYPFIRFLLGMAFAAVLLGLVVALVVHYLYGGIRIQPPGPRVSAAAQSHLSVLLAVICALKAVAYWFDRYGLALKSESLVQGFTGLKYRDIHAQLPALQILTFVAAIVAVLFLVNAFRRSWFVAGAGLGTLVVAAIVIGGIYPAVVQQFQVRPSELVREAESIENNIQATRQAYDLVDVEVIDYNAAPEPNRQVLRQQTGTLDAVRIVDPAVVSPTFRALQQIRSFYSFPDVLDVDRYMIEGTERGAVVATREVDLNGINPSQRNWANDHLVYTHGYGFVAAFDNAKQANGNPVWMESDIPPEGALNITQPRVYFGESSPEYSIVGAEEGAEPRELDFPDDSAPSGQRNNTYEGTGGVPMGSAINRLLFAVKYQEPNILLSNLINSESRILFDRDPQTIVAKVAPWLQVDSDPYPVIANGRVKWIIDGYTTTNSYPFSSRVVVENAVSDSAVTMAGASAVLQRSEINYIRNSVKVVVDAYEGMPTLYAWDPDDPLLKAWEGVFPGTVVPASEMDPEVLAHVRYPEDIFKIQRQIFARYHVTDPAAFYSGQDFWVIPNDPTRQNLNQFQPPYYLILQMPGEETPRFSLTTTFAPINRPTLAAFAAVDSTPGETYGRFQVLQLPRNTTIPGPVQVQNNFESDPNVASQLSLLRRGGADVVLGNLLSLPVGDGVLYVEPVYVRAVQDGFPLLQKILVGFGEKVEMRDTLGQALEAAGVIPAGRGGGGGGDRPDPDNGQTTPDDLPLIEQLVAALDEAQAAFNDGQRALSNGDFAAYGDAQARLERALQRANDIQAELRGETQDPEG